MPLGGQRTPRGCYPVDEQGQHRCEAMNGSEWQRCYKEALSLGSESAEQGAALLVIFEAAQSACLARDLDPAGSDRMNVYHVGSSTSSLHDDMPRAQLPPSRHCESEIRGSPYVTW
ncbi:uncharacterized protein N7518_003420 [Penicillium psychrosexuale]|uniref:uncharacterized protein n=1 Tax=Penicillium psychrosexuale TaxID=1002107 RepID=UPI002544FAC8|nr:uncharacterized protein N7518_003420 [Penicillium psychrosexuale]KAJ5801352.1 hypothetical protein N7518_003420 [Penicillium psychrosexuale]